MRFLIVALLCALSYAQTDDISTSESTTSNEGSYTWEHVVAIVGCAVALWLCAFGVYKANLRGMPELDDEGNKHDEYDAESVELPPLKKVGTRTKTPWRSGGMKTTYDFQDEENETILKSPIVIGIDSRENLFVERDGGVITESSFLKDGRRTNPEAGEIVSATMISESTFLKNRAPRDQLRESTFLKPRDMQYSESHSSFLHSQNYFLQHSSFKKPPLRESTFLKKQTVTETPEAQDKLMDKVFDELDLDILEQKDSEASVKDPEYIPKNFPGSENEELELQVGPSQIDFDEPYAVLCKNMHYCVSVDTPGTYDGITCSECGKKNLETFCVPYYHCWQCDYDVCLQCGLTLEQGDVVFSNFPQPSSIPLLYGNPQSSDPTNKSTSDDAVGYVPHHDGDNRRDMQPDDNEEMFVMAAVYADHSDGDPEETYDMSVSSIPEEPPPKNDQAADPFDVAMAGMASRGLVTTPLNSTPGEAMHSPSEIQKVETFVPAPATSQDFAPPDARKPGNAEDIQQPEKENVMAPVMITAAHFPPTPINDAVAPISWEAVETLEFEADFQSEILGKEELFQSGWDETIGTACLGLDAGSVIVTHGGSNAQVQEANRKIQNDGGIGLPGFRFFALKYTYVDYGLDSPEISRPIYPDSEYDIDPLQRRADGLKGEYLEDQSRTFEVEPNENEPEIDFSDPQILAAAAAAGLYIPPTPEKKNAPQDFFGMNSPKYDMVADVGPREMDLVQRTPVKQEVHSTRYDAIAINDPEEIELKSRYSEPVILDPNEEQYLRHIFAEADRNNDGKVSAIELVKAIKHNPELMDLLGVEGETREQKKDFLMYKMSEIDTDNDGEMSLEEFMYWYQLTAHPNRGVKQETEPSPNTVENSFAPAVVSFDQQNRHNAAKSNQDMDPVLTYYHDDSHMRGVKRKRRTPVETRAEVQPQFVQEDYKGTDPTETQSDYPHFPHDAHIQGGTLVNSRSAAEPTPQFLPEDNNTVDPNPNMMPDLQYYHDDAHMRRAKRRAPIQSRTSLSPRPSNAIGSADDPWRAAGTSLPAAVPVPVTRKEDNATHDPDVQYYHDDSHMRGPKRRPAVQNHAADVTPQGFNDLTPNQELHRLQHGTETPSTTNREVAFSPIVAAVPPTQPQGSARGSPDLLHPRWRSSRSGSVSEMPKSFDAIEVLEFDADFQKEIVGREARFRKSWESDIGTSCMSLNAGSIIVKHGGTQTQMKKANRRIEKAGGIELYGFPFFPLKTTDEKETLNSPNVLDSTDPYQVLSDPEHVQIDIAPARTPLQDSILDDGVYSTKTPMNTPIVQPPNTLSYTDTSLPHQASNKSDPHPPIQNSSNIQTVQRRDPHTREKTPYSA